MNKKRGRERKQQGLTESMRKLLIQEKCKYKIGSIIIFFEIWALALLAITSSSISQFLEKVLVILCTHRVTDIKTKGKQLKSI